jgi:hypothetical protein
MRKRLSLQNAAIAIGAAALFILPLIPAAGARDASGDFASPTNGAGPASPSEYRPYKSGPSRGAFHGYYTLPEGDRRNHVGNGG